QTLQIGVSLEAGRLASDLHRRKPLHGQQSRPAEPLEFVQAGLAEAVGRAVEREGVGLQKGLDLLAYAPVIARGEEDLDAIEQAVAGEGDAQGLPGPVMSPLQGLRQLVAVV